MRFPLKNPDVTPIRDYGGRKAPSEQLIIDDQAQQMHEDGIIEKSRSAWSFPVVLARKKDGSQRFCVNYRRLNAELKLDAYPLPRIDDVLDTLGGALYFSTLDMASGYWQFEIAESDRELTAFSTRRGHFQFRYLPFGISSAPAIFQRTIDLLLSGLSGHAAIAYLDDIMVVGRTFDEHLDNLSEVFKRLRENNFHLRLEKCHFFCSSVEYLGHVVSANGVQPSPDKVKAVREYPRPTDQKGVVVVHLSSVVLPRALARCLAQGSAQPYTQK